MLYLQPPLGTVQDPYHSDIATATTIPDISFVTPRWGVSSVLEFPDSATSFGTEGFFGPNLRVTAVPEPSTLALGLTGLGIAVGFALRRRAANLSAA